MTITITLWSPDTMDACTNRHGTLTKMSSVQYRTSNAERNGPGGSGTRDQSNIIHFPSEGSLRELQRSVCQLCSVEIHFV
jgi:hypothetical protein